MARRDEALSRHYARPPSSSSSLRIWQGTTPAGYSVVVERDGAAGSRASLRSTALTDAERQL
jgi:hypothetical protein